MSHPVLIWSGFLVSVYLIINLLIYPRILSTINYIVLFDFVRALRPKDTNTEQINFTKRIMRLHGFHDLRVRVQKHSLPIEKYLPEVVLISKQLKHRVQTQSQYDDLVGRFIRKHWGSQTRIAKSHFLISDQRKQYDYYEQLLNQSPYHNKYLVLVMLLTVYDLDRVIL